MQSTKSFGDVLHVIMYVVTQLLDMTEEDITEKPNGDALHDAIDRLRADRKAVSEECNSLVHATEDLNAWLSAHDLDPELKFFLMSDNVTDGTQLMNMHCSVVYRVV